MYDEIIKFMNSPLGIAIIPSFIALFGIIISLWWTTSKASKEMEKALRVYESELNKKVYASSKRSDMEYERINKLTVVCVEILLLMQRLYPDKISTFVINYGEKATINDLALKIRDLDNEINISRAFIPGKIISKYEELCEEAERFFVDADKHNLCWDDNSKEDHQRKTELRDVAYESRLKYAETWKNVNEQVKEYLLAAE